MAQYDNDKIIDCLEIRDTNIYFSDSSIIQGLIPKTIAIQNNLNQSINVQLQGSLTSSFDIIFDIETPKIITSGNHYININDYFPFMRVKISALLSPLTGDISVYILK